MKHTDILFDLDGTITDPREGITKAVQYALSKLDIIENDIAKLESFIGPPLQESFATYYQLNEFKTWEAVEAYREYFKEIGIYENKLYEGITELLSILQSNGRKLYIATSKPTVFAETIINHFKLTSYFTGVFGSELDGTRSNKTELIQFIMDINNLVPSNTIMIGDRKHDLIGAHNNKIDSIGVGYGYGSQEELMNARPTFYYKTVQELIKAYL